VSVKSAILSTSVTWNGIGDDGKINANVYVTFSSFFVAVYLVFDTGVSVLILTIAELVN
jgi:hypothetical protein